MHFESRPFPTCKCKSGYLQVSAENAVHHVYLCVSRSISVPTADNALNYPSFFLALPRQLLLEGFKIHSSLMIFSKSDSAGSELKSICTGIGMYKQ